jgi:hypothetical protein
MKVTDTGAFCGSLASQEGVVTFGWSRAYIPRRAWPEDYPSH